jgi:mannose-1-phosphate guanylyltransferase
MSNQKILPVVLSGGAGTRLWPLSRNGYPKQFLTINSDLSLFQQALKRLDGLNNALPTMIVCNEEHRFLIAEQAQVIKHSLMAILLEPVARNTAPAIALAAIKALEQGEDPLLLVLPSDHVFADPVAFQVAVTQAAELASNNYLVTFGIEPSYPETGFGYIKAGKITSSLGFYVERFIEKPELLTAQQYINDGGYFWNSGMFMFKASRYLEELKIHHPSIYNNCLSALTASKYDLDFCRVDAELFTACQDISIDYAVMEKTSQAVVMPLKAGWNDVGAWRAVWSISEQDEQGNAFYGDVLMHDARNSYAYSQSRLVCLLGVENLTVVETPDVVLVAHTDKAQDVKKMVEKLKLMKRKEATEHRQVYRPWGKYDSVDEGHRFKVKRITVKPGEKLSVQMHYHRAEHWIVVSGTANVFLNNEKKIISENESIYIPIGCIHTLENPGKLPLELIEVQTGAYLQEDDIVRFDDRYGRK